MHPRKLIIHIGSHKTGSTSIQSALFMHREALVESGFSLFNHNLDGRQLQKGNTNCWTRFKPGSNVECEIRDGLAQELRALAGNVIISAEHFSWVFDETELQRFHDQLKDDFDEFTVIAYVRRQDKQAVSHYQQGMRFNAFAASRYYDGNFRALPVYREHFQLYLNYFQKLSMWGNVFGDANMIVRVFDKEFLRDGDIVADFFSAIGLDISVEAQLRNESRGFEKTKLGHLMNRMRVSRRLSELLLRYSDDSGKLLPSRQDARAFYEHFRQSNRLLNEKYAINGNTWLFNEDFDMYPVDSQDTWTEDLANRAILNLLAGVNHLPALHTQDVVLLREASRRMTFMDSEKGVALAQMTMRHSGKHIEVSASQVEAGPRGIRAPYKNILNWIRKLF